MHGALHPQALADQLLTIIANKILILHQPWASRRPIDDQLAISR